MKDVKLTEEQREVLSNLAPTPDRLVSLVRQYGNAVRQASVRAERKAARELLTIMMGRKPTKEQIDKAVPD